MFREGCAIRSAGSLPDIAKELGVEEVDSDGEPGLALDVAEVERAHIEALVMRNPTLLQDMGRVIDERRANVRRALSTITDH